MRLNRCQRGCIAISGNCMDTPRCSERTLRIGRDVDGLTTKDVRCDRWTRVARLTKKDGKQGG